MTTALILIDIQTGFDAPVLGPRNNPGAEDNAARLLAHGRKTGWDICHVFHNSNDPDSPLRGDGMAFKPQVTPKAGEQVFEKSVHAAFIGTPLLPHLREIGATQLVICGLTTPHCVSTTARMAGNLGFLSYVIHDACAAFAANADAGWAGPDAPALSPEAMHYVALSHLHGEFAAVRSTADMIARG